MRKRILLTLALFLLLAVTTSTEALPIGSCYGSCVDCGYDIDSRGESSIFCGETGTWAYCTCQLEREPSGDLSCTARGFCWFVISF